MKHCSPAFTANKIAEILLNDIHGGFAAAKISRTGTVQLISIFGSFREGNQVRTSEEATKSFRRVSHQSNDPRSKTSVEMWKLH